MSSIIQAATGIVFWIVATRLYSTDAVGLASATIAVVSLIALISTIGLDFALIRFLPNAGPKSQDMLNSCITIGGLASIVLALIFVAGLEYWSPALLPIRENAVFISVFVLSIFAAVISSLIQQAFVAKREAGFILMQGLLFSLLRFIPLVILSGVFQTFGIFTSWGVALSFSVAISIFLFMPRIEPDYRPLPVVRTKIIKSMLHFSYTNYLANIAWSIPGIIFPLMVVNMLGSEQNAYFYISWTISSILFAIPLSISFSLFAEGSNNEDKLMHEATRSLKLSSLILAPFVIIILVAGDRLLLVFGGDYSENSTWLLRILALSVFPLSINYIYLTIKRVQMKMRNVVAFSSSIAISTIGLSYVLLPHIGINGVGIAWLASQSGGAVTATYRILRSVR